MYLYIKKLNILKLHPTIAKLNFNIFHITRYLGNIVLYALSMEFYNI